MQPPQPPPARTPWFLRPQQYGLTLANGVTAVRLVLVPFIAMALLGQDWSRAFWLTLVAGASDAIDGFLARHFSHKSAIGAYLDPIADKILIVTLFGLLTAQGHLPLWLMIIVLARDVAIVATVAAFNRMAGQPLRMKPLFISKLTTFFQVLLLLVTMADLAFALGLETPRLIIALVAGGFTVASWIAYYFEGQRAIREAGAAKGG
ncbi:MAG: CDP-alcohol phosphatidyltransferase family protein [Phycisphaerae bacterium]|jgi:cardiolipin synthase